MRVSAVECLEAIVTLPYSSVYPLRLVVVNGLGPVLDDPKRAVRKAAVRCRNEWFVLAAPG